MASQMDATITGQDQRFYRIVGPMIRKAYPCGLPMRS